MVTGGNISDSDGVMKRLGIDEGIGNTVSMEDAMNDGVGEGIKMLMERVNSEDGIGISLLSEDDSNIELNNTVVSGVETIRVELCSSEVRLIVGVG